MRKYFGAAAAVVFILAIVLAVWQGGRDIFKSPVASIPSVLVDSNNDQTEILIHGMNDFKYTNMTIRVTTGNDSFEQTRNDTYFMDFMTPNDTFTVNVTVWNKDRGYSFNASFQVTSPTEATRLLTLYENRNDKIYTYILDDTKLPWKRLMERMR